MKRNRLGYVSMIILSFVVMSGCSKNLFDVQEEFDVQTSITVQGNNAEFTAEQFLDVISESDMIKQYADKLKSIEIIGISYYVSEFRGTATQQINWGYLQIADADGNYLQELASVQNVNLISATVERDLAFHADIAAQLSDYMLEAPHTCMLYLTGEINEVPADFTVVIKLRVKMVAEVL